MAINVIARACDQKVVTAPDGSALTVHDKGHLPYWRRGRGHRHSGELTMAVTQQDGLPILTITTIETSGDETREVKFQLFGSSAVEALELLRYVEAPAERMHWL